MKKYILLVFFAAVFISLAGCSDKRGASRPSPYLLADQSALAAESMAPYAWFSAEVEQSIKDLSKKVVPLGYYVASTTYAQSPDVKELEVSAVKMGKTDKGSSELKVEINSWSGAPDDSDKASMTEQSAFDVEDMSFKKYAISVTTDVGQKIAVGTLCRADLDESTVDVGITAVEKGSDEESTSATVEDCEGYLTSTKVRPIDTNFRQALTLLNSWMSVSPCEPASVVLGSSTVRVNERVPSSQGSVEVRHECPGGVATTVFIQRNKIDQYKAISCEGEVTKTSDGRQVCITEGKESKVYEMNSASFFIKTEGVATPESLLNILQVLTPTKDVGFESKKS